MADHIVQPGDCFNSLAKENGYYNYLTLYNHATNATTHTKPNMLVEGTTVKIPDQKTPKKAPLTLDKETKFVLDRQPTKLRVAVLDAEGKDLPKVTAVAATVGTATASKLGAHGLVELKIEADVKAGTLNFKLPAPTLKVDKSKATKKGSVPAHPPVIPDKDFEDEVDDPDGQPITVELDLQIGFLEPHTEIRGALQRLNNLGCKVPDATAKTADDDPTKVVVKSYQKFKNKADDAPSGLIAALQAGLETDHDTI